ncbi:hypothetical protein TRAPUB_9760 [Trametes pubescens]|uniref:Uncharacterized protein n=1 Tax=Trametes pubescens TaxID=154538 RepID=A0A1M2W1D0_TRAPU|nr:hypothetical protein TRAPUB_9760 [Trametes pubescens]
MSHALTTPSLSGVLLVLNIVLALVWVAFLDSVDDSTNVFHAVLLVNATTTAWWIWINTSLSGYARALCRIAVSAVQLLGPPPAILQAPRLLSLRVRNTCDGGTFVVAPPRSPPSPARCNSSETLVEEDFLLHATEDANASDEQLSEDWSCIQPTPTALVLLHGSRSSTPPTSGFFPIHRLSFNDADPVPISNLAPSRASLSDAQLPDNVRLTRAVRILTRERDLYRSRAYQLATRLDDCYGTHEQTRRALERAESAAIDTQHILRRLDAERRDLSLALAATLTVSGGRATNSTAAADPRKSAEGTMPASHARPPADDISSPQTPVKRAGADERPLLLPPTAETTEDTPTRPRNATWASPGRSRLEDILMHTRRRAEVLAQAQKKGLGAVWDAQRAASARPIFSVVHEGIRGDKVAAGAEEDPVLTAEQKSAYGIIDDLRISRPCTSPSTSPVLDSEKGVDKPMITVSEAQVPCKPEETVQKTSSDTVAAQKTASEMLAVPMQAMPVRQPRGPPPSPLVSLAQKALAQALQRPSAHTWRGRTQATGIGADDTKFARASTSTSPDPPSQPTTTYPTSRMPNRVHARQATAPPTSRRIDPMVILQAAMPAGVPKATVSLMTGKDSERRRHATFNGTGAGGTPAFASGSANMRWQASASGREAIEPKRRVAETAQGINSLLNSLSHKTSSRALVAGPEPVGV